jgi:hypothetical protein
VNFAWHQDADLAKRKAVKLAAFKLDWTHQLEEHVGKSCSLIWIKIAVSGRRGLLVMAFLLLLLLFNHFG